MLRDKLPAHYERLAASIREWEKLHGVLVLDGSPYLTTMEQHIASDSWLAAEMRREEYRRPGVLSGIHSHLLCSVFRGPVR